MPESTCVSLLALPLPCPGGASHLCAMVATAACTQGRPRRRQPLSTAVSWAEDPAKLSDVRAAQISVALCQAVQDLSRVVEIPFRKAFFGWWWKLGGDHRVPTLGVQDLSNMGFGGWLDWLTTHT
jgi:hypothetical protein